MSKNPITLEITNDQNYLLIYFRNGSNKNIASPLLAPYAQLEAWIHFFAPAEEILEPRVLTIETAKGTLEFSLARDNGHYRMQVQHPEQQRFTFNPSPDLVTVAHTYLQQVKKRRKL